MTKTVVCFSPKGGCETEIVKVISKAQHEILLMIFSFTSTVIAAALIAAVARGVRVSIIADPRCVAEPHTQLPALKAGGANVLIDSAHVLMHNKCMVADQKVLVTGSYNYTFQAEHSNAENVIALDSPSLADIYIRNFNFHAQHAQAMV